MRTKALLLTAALGAAGIATSMAQVYSVNAVGYVNVSVPLAAAPKVLTYAMLSNPLNGTNNNINTILPSVPDGSQVFRFTTGAGFNILETYYLGVGWDPGTTELPPGEGFMMVLDNVVSPNPTTVTFVGEVPQGNLTNAVPTGYSVKSSIVPQAGSLSAVLGFDPPSDTQVFKWNIAAQTYPIIYTYFGGGLWDPSEPTVEVAEGFFILNPGSGFQWGRSFTVN